jgi:hypothetical protein
MVNPGPLMVDGGGPAKLVTVLSLKRVSENVLPS